MSRTPESMHAVHVGFFCDPRRREPLQLLEDWPSLVDVAEAAACAGAHVSVLQASTHIQSVMRNDIRYDFFPFGRAARTLAEHVRRLAPDILHVHGLDFPRDVRALSRAVPGVPILLQDHASHPPRWWRRWGWRRGFAAAAGIAFCAAEQSQPFIRAGLIRASTHVYDIPESSSRFTPGDRAQAQRDTGLFGDPCVLWVGHLDRNKDPLTMLAGISEVVRSLPELQLWCCYGTAPLLTEVRERINIDERLRQRVHLVGRLPHEGIESCMRAADLFVLGSHHEGSGYSVIEAMACGLPPVITDIPSFRALTRNGSIGALWPCERPDKLAASLLEVAHRPREPERARTRAHFEGELSFGAVGRKLNAAYRDLQLRGAACSSSSLPSPRASLSHE